MAQRKLRISLGSDNFKNLVTTSDIFVDKSLFIKEVLESAEDAILITRPRRWGKSLALDMLKTFLDINHDKVAHVNVNQKLFEPLKIAAEKTDENAGYIDRYLGKYPVIHITLKDVTSSSLNEVIDKIQFLVKNLYKEHKYLLKSDHIDNEDKKDFQKYIDLDYGKISLENSIKFLSKLLYEYHKQKVYILVDEYDKPVNYLLEKNLANRDDVVNKIAYLITNILSSCGKSNDYLEKIILTGIFDSLKKEDGSGFNNIKVYGVDHSKFALHFGFSKEEIDKQLLLKLMPDDNARNDSLDLIKQWYNGYSIPLVNSGRIEAYTAWAVMNHISALNDDAAAQPQGYWVSSGASTIFQALLKGAECEGTPFMNSLLNIIVNGEVSLHYNNGVSLFKYPLEDASQDERIFSYLLLNSGYLTAINQNNTHITLAIPNFEVKQELKDVFDSHLQHVKDKKNHVCQKIQEGLGRTEILEKSSNLTITDTSDIMDNTPFSGENELNIVLCGSTQISSAQDE